MKKNILALTVLFIISLTIEAQIVNNWRGPERDGKYPDKNLLKEWPENGPKMLWAYEKLDKGFTSPVIMGEKIYITAIEGKMGYLYILTLDGKIIKKMPYGEEVYGKAEYPGTRSTPTFVENLKYIATGHGKLICMDINSGTNVWVKDLFKDFDGKNIRWSLTENLIIDGDILYVAPGGKKYNVVALNRHNGNLIWESPGMGELSAYCSPLLFEHNGRKILATMMGTHILGLDAKDGSLLWSFPYKNRHNIYPNTPLYRDNSLYFYSGYGKGGQKFSLSEDGNEIELIWTNEDLDDQMGGVILIDNYLYGSGHRNRRWFVLDWETGETKFETRDIDKGTVIYADGMLYAYTERGELALIKPQGESLKIVSQTEITLGEEQHWAHLVIHNGILYVRHGSALMAFDIREK